MGWLPFGLGSSSSTGSSSSSSSATTTSSPSEYDAWVPPPPAGVTLAPPSPPRHMEAGRGAAATAAGKIDTSSAAAAPFKGFSPPPPAATPSVSDKESKTPASSSSYSSLLPWATSRGAGEDSNNYEKEDFSRYTASGAPVTGSYVDRSYGADDQFSRYDRVEAPGLLDRCVTNPRLRACLEGVKMGMKMGAAVGGIFGILTGSYAAVVNRNFWILPMSAVGGAVSFSFFLGCGMIVRCDDKAAVRTQHLAFSPPLLHPLPPLFFSSSFSSSRQQRLLPAASYSSAAAISASASASAAAAAARRASACRRTPFGLAVVSSSPRLASS